LLYTAVTRSRLGVAIVGGAEVLEKAIMSPTRRYSGLVARLYEASGRCPKQVRRSSPRLGRPGASVGPVGDVNAHAAGRSGPSRVS
jgi:hypothetical protein